MHALSDPRNRPALLGSVLAGAILFLGAWLWLGWSPLLAWVIGWSVPAFAVYGIDKWQAQRGGWRVPEVVLHALALIGGFPGAWAGRIVFHHKTNKPAFLVVLVVATVVWVAVILWAMFVR